MFVQRFAKAVAVGVSLGMTTVVPRLRQRALALAVHVGVIAVWVVAARAAGRGYPGATSDEHPRRRAA